MNLSKRDANGLNKRERAIIKCIQKGIIENGYAPSVREICKAVSLSSTATVHGYLLDLEEKGFLVKEKDKGRTLRLLKDNKGNAMLSDKNGITGAKKYYSNQEMVNVPLIGKVAAGLPILAIENIEDNFPIPIEFTGNQECFMLKVQGESMIEIGIFDDDYILVKKQNVAENGDIVVALVDDSATVKRFFKEKDYIRLQPENSTMDPIIVPDCRILGKVGGVFRKL